MFRFIFILAAFVATSAKAELTQRDLRQIAYDGDIARIEATFADLHKQSLDGTISADKLRSLVSGLVVSHPDILDFTQAWQESQPRSPYVNAVRAFQFSEQSFHLRGDRLWRDTPVIARDAFFRLQQSAMEMAVQAYEAAPDFIPASDAVFVVNRTTHVLDSAGLDQLRRDVLSKSHDFGSLTQSLRSADTNWGGEGGAEIYRVCGEFAPLVTDVESYDQTICTIHNIYKRTTDAPSRAWAAEALGDRTDKILTFARAMRAIENADRYRLENGYELPDIEEDRAAVLAYLSLPEVYDRDVARRFQRMFRGDDESIAVIDALAERSQTWLEVAIQSDPLNIQYMRELSREAPLISSSDGASFMMDMEQEKLFNVRRAMAQPFHRNAWMMLGSQVRPRPEKGRATEGDNIYINAIAYSGNAASEVVSMMGHKLKMYWNYQRVLRESPDYEIMPYGEVETGILCPIVRLERLNAAQCAAENSCGQTLFQDEALLAEVLNKINEEDICKTEREAPIGELFYEPTKVGFDHVYVGIENRD